MNRNEYAILLKESMEKIATDKNFGKAILYGLGVGAGFLFISTLAQILKDKYRIAMSESYFQKMLEANPQLKEYDPELVAKYFNSLYHFAPTTAQDPVAAGAFVTQSIRRLDAAELGGPPPDTYKVLSDIEDKLQRSKGSTHEHFGKVFSVVGRSLIHPSFF